ncbi:hypothetical protein BH10ACI1_BH10ACI1_22080 [soil metagenome]
MTNKQNNIPPSSEQESTASRNALALKISKEAIIALNLPEMISAEREAFTKKRYEVFYQEEETNIALSIEFDPGFTKGMLHISLTSFVWHILMEIESLLSNHKAIEQLAIKDSEREKVIFDKTLALTKEFILHLPAIIFHSFHQTAKETIINHIKKIVESDLREHWGEMHLPKDFTLLPKNNLKDLLKLFPNTKLIFCEYLEDVDQEFTAYRKGIYSNRQVLLTPQAFANLPNDYENLRILYKQAKNEYILEYQAFERINRGTTNEWGIYWEKVYDEKLPIK